MGPTLAGFIAFLYSQVGIPQSALPNTSPYIPFAYNVAVNIVNPILQIACGPGSDPTLPSIYALAVYNLATSNIFNFAQDQEGNNYFEGFREKWNINGYVSGTVAGSSDEGTSNTMVVPEAAETFTLADLQLTKDPYGRQYLILAQKFGPRVWGLS